MNGDKNIKILHPIQLLLLICENRKRKNSVRAFYFISQIEANASPGNRRNANVINNTELFIILHLFVRSNASVLHTNESSRK